MTAFFSGFRNRLSRLMGYAIFGEVLTEIVFPVFQGRP